MEMSMLSCRGLLTACLLWCSAVAFAADGPLNLKLQRQTPVAEGLRQFHTVTESQSWKPGETAIILCDVWDSHTCENAVKRVNELTPRLNEVVLALRKTGVTVIHAPSNCMDSYADHPGRQRAMAAPKAAVLPPEIQSWCYKIPSEEQGIYPIDQSDGGCDDEPEQHAKWTAVLIKEGRDPKRPWKKQTAGIAIDNEKDFISDSGVEVWNVLESKGIKNVILAGVHTNMCVLGRPFGLRRMAQNGKNAVLLRDMTDTMYNPKAAPYVSHFTGTDLIIAHIERHVCPTITSDQLIGGKTFRFKNDTRPHVVVVASEPEYDTARTLTEYAVPHLGKDFRITHVYGDAKDGNELPGLEVLKEADVLLLSARRRTLRTEQLELVRQYIASGKPAVGIRTASHAFSIRKGEVPSGHAQWPELDAEVWGGSYSNHYGNDLKCEVTPAAETASHPILAGIPQKPFAVGGSLYQTAPLAKGTTVLMSGKVHAKEAEPVSWTFTRKDGGKSFYTSLGHVDDFANPVFTTLLTNAVYWAAGKEPSKTPAATAMENRDWDWKLVSVPTSVEQALPADRKNYEGPVWFRTGLRIPEWVASEKRGMFGVDVFGNRGSWVRMNGRKRPGCSIGELTNYGWETTDDQLVIGEANLLAVYCEDRKSADQFLKHPVEVAIYGWDQSGIPERYHTRMTCTWQMQLGEDQSFAAIPLPAQFALPPLAYFELPATRPW
jgi:type 1 glutamine amidotransferase/nicotinamidase-related amidase